MYANTSRRFILIFWILLTSGIVFSIVAGCTKKPPKQNPEKTKLQFLTSTSILGDILSNLIKDSALVTTFIPIYTDPHHYTLTPSDLKRITQADFILLNGLGLESGYIKLIQENARSPIYSFGDSVVQNNHFVSDIHPEHQGLDDDGHLDLDPHFWFDPLFVRDGVKKLVAFLSTTFPNYKFNLQENGNVYIGMLEQIHRDIEQIVATIPKEKKYLLSDHYQFRYFCKRYHFEEIGAVIPSFHTHSSPSSKALGQLGTIVQQKNIRVIFVDKNMNNPVIELFAKDNGLRIVRLQTVSLGEVGSTTDSYFKFLRWNVEQISAALKE